MIPRELIATAKIPGGEDLQLFRHGGDFMIVLERNELMSTRMRWSEESLATLSCERVGDTPKPHLLIGGYGMGFTLRAALNALPRDATVTIAELVPDIIAWARGPMADVAAGCLDDPRVRLIMGDVAKVIETAPATFDAILLDVDNGPDGLIQLANDRLYCNWGLRSAHAALSPGGILAIWSSYSDAGFFERLERAGFDVDEITIRADSYGVEANHTIWLAAKPG